MIKTYFPEQTHRMMKNTLLLATLLLLVLLTSCARSDSQLRDKLEEAVTSGKPTAAGYQVIQLEDLTDFDWETMYFFDEGVDNSFISVEIGFKWEGPKVPAQHRRMLFVNEGKVVDFADYDYAEFPLTVYGCNQDRWVYPKSRSSFASFKYCQDDKEFYTFIPVECLENFRSLMQLKCKEGGEAK